MDTSEALAVLDALPNPPKDVAPSVAALLSPSYWKSTLSDLDALSACLNCLEEQDAVITCRRLANELVPAQKDVLLSRCKRIVQHRATWMEELDNLRKVVDDDQDRNNAHQNRSTIPSAEMFCDKTMERLAADQDLCIWQSQLLVTSGNSRLVLQLKVSQSVAEVLELPETFNNGTAVLSSSRTLSERGNNNTTSTGPSPDNNVDVLVFRSAPLKRAGTWISPNPHTLSKDSQQSSGSPDEDQILYYLRLYLSLGGERKGSGEFLSETLVKEVATLLATQIALFDLTQTSGAKFDIAPQIPQNKDLLHHVLLANRSPKWLKKCCTTFPSEAAAGRPVGGVVTALVPAGIPAYNPMSIQLHDVTSFTWALKYCYGEVLRRSSTFGKDLSTYYVPPSVAEYVNQHVLPHSK